MESGILRSSEIIFGLGTGRGCLGLVVGDCMTSNRCQLGRHLMKGKQAREGSEIWVECSLAPSELEELYSAFRSSCEKR